MQPVPGFYVVATTIGNIEDITLRALEVLKSSDIILSEDTRQTSKLLTHFNILHKSQIPYRDESYERIVPMILQALAENKIISLVSDCGTPLISDPGYKIVHKVLASGYKVIPIPGPSAVVSALSVSGLPTDKFVFLGFLPKKINQRLELLKKYGALESTLTIYESPFRVTRLLHEIHETLGDRMVCIAKDLTKNFELVETKRLSEFIAHFSTSKTAIKGEFVILIGKSDL